MTTVVYVAGYGRSGSTLLALLLGTHPDIRSLGEAGMIWEQLKLPDSECSCGATLASCDFWRPIRQRVLDACDLDTIARAAVAEEHFFRRFVPGLHSAGTLYRDANRLLLDVAAGSHGIGHVVDTSKTAYRFAWRPRALYRRCGIEVRILHLMRRPSRVLASCLKGRNSRLSRALPDHRRFEVMRTLVGWNLANLFAALNGRILGTERYLRVDFDDLLQSPGAQLSRIGKFLGVDLDPVAARVRAGEPLTSAHLISVNRMARAGVVRVDAGPDRSPQLPGAGARLSVRLLSQPLYKFLKPTD